MVRQIVVAGFSLVLVSGCAAISPVQIGQTVGMIGGATAVPGVGAPVGALLGTIVGTIFQKRVDQETEQRERKELAEQLGTPAVVTSQSKPIAPPQGEPVRVWVDEFMQDGNILAGRFEVRHLQ